MSRPEDRYRRLLQVYPSWYRAERGEEILATLQDSGQSRRGRVSLGKAASLVVHGVALRFDLGEGGALGELAGRLATPALTLAGLLSMVALIFGELIAPSYAGGPVHLAPFLTLGPIAYVAWIGAFVVDVASSSRYQRPATLVAVVATGATFVVGDIVAPGRTPLFFLATLAAFAVQALVRPDVTRASLRPRSVGAAVAIGAAVLAASGLATLAGSAGPGVGASWSSALSGFAPSLSDSNAHDRQLGAGGRSRRRRCRRDARSGGAATDSSGARPRDRSLAGRSRRACFTPAAQLAGGSVIAIALVGIGYSHQARATRQVEKA